MKYLVIQTLLYEVASEITNFIQSCFQGLRDLISAIWDAIMKDSPSIYHASSSAKLATRTSNTSETFERRGPPCFSAPTNCKVLIKTTNPENGEEEIIEETLDDGQRLSDLYKKYGFIGGSYHMNKKGESILTPILLQKKNKLVKTGEAYNEHIKTSRRVEAFQVPPSFCPYTNIDTLDESEADATSETYEEEIDFSIDPEKPETYNPFHQGFHERSSTTEIESPLDDVYSIASDVPTIVPPIDQTPTRKDTSKNSFVEQASKTLDEGVKKLNAASQEAMEKAKKAGEAAANALAKTFQELQTMDFNQSIFSRGGLDKENTR